MIVIIKDKIFDFNLIYQSGNAGKDVKSLSPIGVNWLTSESTHQIMDVENSIDAKQINEYFFACIKCPFEQNVNRNNCLIFNSKGEVFSNLRELLNPKMDSKLFYFMAFDTFDQEVNVIINMGQNQYRITYDITDNAIKKIRPIRW